MQLSMYQASVPVFTRMLEGLTACIDKAVADAAARKYDPTVLVGTRLRVDMMPFAQQVQVATNHATGAPARLAGLALPDLGDNEGDLDQVLGRIRRALDFIRAITPTQIDGTEQKEITLPKRAHVPHLALAGLPQPPQDNAVYPMTLTGRDYLLAFAMPNFYFHVTTAYVILRCAGVDIGKQDYLGQIPRIGR